MQSNMIWTDAEVYMGKGTKWIEKDGIILIRNLWEDADTVSQGKFFFGATIDFPTAFLITAIDHNRCALVEITKDGNLYKLFFSHKYKWIF